MRDPTYGQATRQVGDRERAFAEWHIVERDRIVIRYEFASRRWSGYVEPFDDRTGKFGGGATSPRIETIKSFFELVQASGRVAG